MVGVMNQPFVGETFYGNPRRRLVAATAARPCKLETRAARPLAHAIFTTTAPELYRSDGEKGVLKRLSAGDAPDPLWRRCLFLLRLGGGPDRYRHGCPYGAL